MRRGVLKIGVGWVLCAAAWAACGGEELHTRKDLGFQIGKLAHMTDDPTGVSGLMRLGWIQVVVTGLEESAPLRSFFAIPRYRDLLKHGTLVDIRLVKLDGRTALKVTTFRVAPAKDIDLKLRTITYYTVAGARGYSISVTTVENHSDKDQDEAAAEFDTIVASFKIIEAK